MNHQGQFVYCRLNRKQPGRALFSANSQKLEKQSCQTHRIGIETVDEQSVELRFVIPCQCAQVFELYAGVIG